MYLKYNNKGFTMTEALVTLAISSAVLTSFYQLTFGSVAFFSKNKVESDNLETKTPSIELLSRYFDRWGIGVVTSDLGSTQNEALSVPKTDPKFIKIPSNTNNLGTVSDPITFYANLGGFGFVKNDSTSTVTLLSCRLDDTTLGTFASPCYYVFRNNKFIPNNLNVDNDTITTTINGTSTTIPSIDSISFATAFTTTNSTTCVDNNFISNIANTNSTIGRTATISDSNSTNLGISLPDLIPPPVPLPTSFQLKNGDLIFRTPHRIELYTASNSNDKGNIWLYAKLTPVASLCSSTSVTQEIAPANYIKAKKLKDNSNTDIDGSVEIEIAFRGNPYKGKERTYIVKRVFGG